MPPVPPSAWSANSSMKRRNQFYQNNYQPQQQQQQSTPSTQQQSSITNSRLKKFNVQNNNINGGKEQSPTDTQQQPQQQQASFTTYQQQQTSANQTKQLNGHHYGENETTSKSTELNIGENEHDQQPQKETATATTNQGYYSNTNHNLKNYDNLYETNSKPISSNDFDSSSKYDSCEVDDKIEIIISRDHRFNDFGFTLTRSVYGSEIFVDKIRVASPAESHLYLKPNTKLYKVSLNSFVLFFAFFSVFY